MQVGGGGALLTITFHFIFVMKSRFPTEKEKDENLG